MTDAELGRRVRQTVRAELGRRDAFERDYAAALAAKRAEGYRIVGGGSTGGGDDERWQITDAETREVLARGDTYALADAFEAAWPDDWWHEDGILEGVCERLDQIADEDHGLPRGLAVVVADWAASAEVEAPRLLDADAGPS